VPRKLAEEAFEGRRPPQVQDDRVVVAEADRFERHGLVAERGVGVQRHDSRLGPSAREHGAKSRATLLTPSPGISRSMI
jgi:hypothetical protein